MVGWVMLPESLKSCIDVLEKSKDLPGPRVAAQVLVRKKIQASKCRLKTTINAGWKDTDFRSSGASLEREGRQFDIGAAVVGSGAPYIGSHCARLGILHVPSAPVSVVVICGWQAGTGCLRMTTSGKQFPPIASQPAAPPRSQEKKLKKSYKRKLTE